MRGNPNNDTIGEDLYTMGVFSFIYSMTWFKLTKVTMLCFGVSNLIFLAYLGFLLSPDHWVSL